MPKRDFTRDGGSDLLWRNTTTDQVGYWDVDNGVASWHDLGTFQATYQYNSLGGSTTVTRPVTLIGTAQADSDANIELIWSGQAGGYSLTGGLSASWEAFGWVDTVPGQVGHQLSEYTTRRGTGIVSYEASELVRTDESDFNGDGLSDYIVVTHRIGRATGQSTADWLEIYSGTAGGSVVISDKIGMTGWSVVAVGNFSGSGPDDIMIRNSTTGLTGYWTFGAGLPTGFTVLGNVAANQTAVGVGDFTGDGSADTLWRSQSTGELGFWDIDNNVAFWHGIAFVGMDWQVQRTDDFDSNAISDILWRQDNTGIVGYWSMGQSGQPTDWRFLGTVSPDWQII